MAVPSWVLFRSVQRLDGCDRHQVLHGTGEVPVEGDQRVGVELGQGDVLGVKGVGLPEEAGGLPRNQRPDPQPANVVELSLGIPPGHLTAASCLVEQRQHLGAKERRSQDLVVAADYGLVVSQPNDDVRGRSRTWSWQISSPRLLSHASACPEYRDVEPGHRHHAGASMPGSSVGSMAVDGADRSAAGPAAAAG